MELYPPIYNKRNTDNHRYLHYTSCHPMHMKNSMFFSQLLRYKRICSDSKDFINHSKELVTYFLHIGYSINVILKQWDKASSVHRDSQLTHRENTIDNHIPLAQSCRPTIASTNKSVIRVETLQQHILSETFIL